MTRGKACGLVGDDGGYRHEPARGRWAAHVRSARAVSRRREAVAREFTTLERARLIECRRGAIVLTDPARLGQLIEEAQGLGEQRRPDAARNL